MKVLLIGLIALGIIAILPRADEILGVAPRVILIEQGGLGTSTAPTQGQVLVGQTGGTYALQATSTLGLGGDAFTTTTLNGLSATAYTFSTSGSPGLFVEGSGSTLTWRTATSTASATGFLQSADWTTFNGKQKSLIDVAANGTYGTSSLSGVGSSTISTTAVTATSTIYLTLQSCSTCGTLYVHSRVAGQKFVVDSTNILDASEFAWWVINP